MSREAVAQKFKVILRKYLFAQISMRFQINILMFQDLHVCYKKSTKRRVSVAKDGNNVNLTKSKTVFKVG